MKYLAVVFKELSGVEPAKRVGLEIFSGLDEAKTFCRSLVNEISPREATCFDYDEVEDSWNLSVRGANAFITKTEEVSL